MATVAEAQKLLRLGKVREAGTVVDVLLKTNKDNSELWYLRGLVSLRVKNYDYAHECFVHALEIEKKPAYYKIRGMSYMETYEFEDALTQFEEALNANKKDAEVYFYIALCYLFLNNPLAKSYLEKAYRQDDKKTKNLIKNFFEIFFRGEGALQKNILEKIKKL